MLAQRSMKTSDSLDEQLSYAFRCVICRVPTDTDVTQLRRAYEKQAEFYRTDVDAAKALLSVGVAPRDESLNASEHAALTAVCLGILNLDEALTRE